MHSENLKRKLFQHFQTHGLDAYGIGNLLRDGLQRAWEYFWILDNLPIENSTEATVLDVGCDPACLFPLILATELKFILANDIPPCSVELPDNVVYQQGKIQELPAYRCVDAVTCVSVLEHVEDKSAFCKALDSIAAPILLTCEFSRDDAHIAEQLVTLDVLTDCLSHFQKHYLSRMEECPVWAANSRSGEWRPLALLLLPV